MTAPRATVDSCPECGAPVHNEGGWPPWCPACEWGLAPDSQPTPDKSRWQSLRARRMHARVLAGHARLLGTDLHASSARRALGMALGVLIHLTTLLQVVLAGWLWTTGTFVVVKVLASGLLLVTAWEVRPRLALVPKGDNVLTRSSAPHSFGVLDEVARATGSRAPDLLIVSSAFNASVARVGLRQRTVFTIGLPLWMAIDDRQRVAMLGHECGHEVNGDIRSTLVVGTAIATLRTWSSLLRPDVRATQRRWRYGATNGLASWIVIAEYLVPVILLPLSVTIGLLAVGLDRIASRSGQRAEYRADALAARAAGTDAAVSLLDQFYVADACMQAMSITVRANRQADVWAAQRRFLEALTPAQRERWRRLAARQEHRSDASHPPTLLRQEMLLSRPAVEPVADVSATELARMGAEFTPFTAMVARRLRDTA